jgi:UDP-2,3-diacylglucosamine pyrophosphatase LpxH
VYDAIIISDLHLGSSNCQAKSLCRFLETILYGERLVERLILNGDVFNSFDFRRLTKNHWKVLSLIRKLSDRVEIIWISGNHDGSAEIVSHLLGVTVKDDYVLTSGGRPILIAHGHKFDEFIDAHPLLTRLGDLVYFFLQWIDRTHYFAKLAKRGSKTFLRCARKVHEGAVGEAARRHCEAVCCGHTHHVTSDEAGPIHYFNSGCWTEIPCSYLTIADGRINIQHWDEGCKEELLETAAEPAAA